MTTSNPRSAPRPGGRSARVQAAVHQATRELLEQHPRADLTVPLIAARAGVTPSTVYRRWGDLADLLADVAVDRLRPEAPPADTGSVAGDLHLWADQYFEEMSSEIGLAMMRDVLNASGGGCAAGELPVPSRCAEFTAGQIAAIVDRGQVRGETAPTVEAVMDGVVAPIVYRLLFGPAPPSHAHVRTLVDACLAGAAQAADA